MTREFDAYITAHCSKESELLQEIFRHTHLHHIHPQMMAGQVQGRLLSMLSKMKRPQRILEIGSFTGYSLICLAEGLKKKGSICSIEKNDELEDTLREHISRAGLEEQTDLRIGDALHILPGLQKEYYDLIYIDGAKEEYPDYYRLSKTLLASDGVIIADNVLWDAKVRQPGRDKKAQAIHHFNELIQNDPEVDNLILPFRDGLMMITKK